MTAQGLAAENNESRIIWLDVMKGIGILSVVWGHAGHPYSFLMFFFHMPLFFFISGYLYRPVGKVVPLQYLVRRSKQLLVPYVFYIILITAFLAVLSVLKGQSVDINWTALILGGSKLEGAYGTFWFVTCLFFVQIFFDFVIRKIRPRWLVVLTIAACFVFAFWESRFHQDFFVPWNMDVALFGIVFYALGFLFKQKKWLVNAQLNKIILLFSAVFLILFLYAYFQDYLRFGLDFKHRQYYFFGTNILVPMAAVLLISGLSRMLSNWTFSRKLFSSLGQSSMAIMFLHLFVNSVIGGFITINPWRFLIIGILFPWLWFEFASRIPGLRFLALGINKKKPAIGIDIGTSGRSDRSI
ncbi:MULTISPECIES: acyltransferase family protein [unclassified Dehalobacter]|uniref:acyltransferase family protein n=1 Tax=unclassified Dehalobacter TaxID=2635733 RepID=UPI000E6BD606|nr:MULTISPECIES: acyltransferase family protein [unclassified Dehalobacter]RJE46912.1 acyltransferase [Dehalobacter sp. MCB1]TCX50835.1 acyltransferase [Dehalobacter sp. 12DCB1]TCX51546.1 acyltransferase [Dehalobacter sp. 14DCB1]